MPTRNKQMKAPGDEQVRAWLAHAERNAANCFICAAIAQSNPPSTGRLTSTKVYGVDVGLDTLTWHLKQCIKAKFPKPHAAVRPQ